MINGYVIFDALDLAISLVKNLILRNIW